MRDLYKIPYINTCIRRFARRYGLSLKKSALYLFQFRGLQFLDEFYPAEHLLSLDDAIDDLTKICKENGGTVG